MTEPLKETILAPHVFTPSETEQLGKQLGREYSKRAEILKQKKSFASQYKAKEDECDALIAGLADKLNSGEEMRPVMALVTFDTARKMKLFWDDSDELIREEPMVASDWELPLFKEERPDFESITAKIIPNEFGPQTLMPLGFAVVTTGRSEDGDIALNVERTAWVNVASPGANWDEYHGLARKVAPAEEKRPRGWAQAALKAGHTSIADELAKAAGQSEQPKITFMENEISLSHGNAFRKEFRRAAKYAGWHEAAIDTMGDILKACDSVKEMQETLKPHIDAGEAE